MAGQKPPEAVANFIAPIQLAVDCVAPAYVNVRGGYSPTNNPHTFVLNEGQPIALKALGRSLSLSVTHGYDIVKVDDPERGPWKVSTNGYIYQLIDGDGAILEYHWHPHEGWEIDFPHVHFRRTSDDLAGLHLPTGRVSIEEVIGLAIREFGAEPRRKDHEAVLANGLERFRRWRTWD